MLTTMKKLAGVSVAILVVGIAAGARADGSIVGWGYNGSGQCNVPEPNTGFVAAAGGWGHSLGLKADGSIVAWGYNADGQCNVPAPNTGFVAVAAGRFHSLGLKADGSIVAWGNNGQGQCNVPAPNTGFVAIAAIGYHSLGLKADGSIVAWGSNEYGQCNVPAPNTGFVALATGAGHSLGLKANGSIVAWGSNDEGQCNVPPPNAGFVAIAAGAWHSLGLKADGSIVAWGWNDWGQCNVPAPNTGFAAVAAGDRHSLALKTDGSIVAWGWNDWGQCNVPAPNNSFGAIAAGEAFSLGLKTDGSLQVTIEPAEAVTAGAQWRREGTVAWQDSGTSLTLPTGNYTVEFKNVAGWDTPSTQSVAIVTNQATLTTGTYVRQYGSLLVTIEPAEAVADGAQWSVDGGTTWRDSGSSLTLPTGNYMVTFKQITHWVRPASLAVTLTKDQLLERTGTYTAIGSLQVTIEPAEAITAGARWSVDGGATWRDSGTSLTLLTGNYTVQFMDIGGWDTPSTRDVTITQGQTTQTSGTYARQYGSLQVTIAPAGAVAAGAQWRRVGTTVWRNSSDTEGPILVGEHTIEFKRTPVWMRPANRSVTINNGQTTVVEAVYEGPTSVKDSVWTLY